MTPDEQERTKSLCERIAKEQDQEKFLKLVQELNDLLDRRNERLNPPAKRSPGTPAQGPSQSTE
jgi:hypothetical protein